MGEWSQDSAHVATDDADPRDCPGETPAQRRDREWAELLRNCGPRRPASSC
jgi:hypothetical protein